MDDKFVREVRKIRSLNTEHLSYMLYSLVMWIDAETIVETGSFCGYSTAWLAKAVKDKGSGRVYAIDNFSLGTSAAILHNNLVNCEVADYVQIIDRDSKDAPLPNCIDLAFLDGNHSLEYVTREFLSCVDRGAKIIVLHDTTDWWGCKEFPGHVNYSCIENPMWGGARIYMFKQDISDVSVAYPKALYPEGYAK